MKRIHKIGAAAGSVLVALTIVLVARRAKAAPALPGSDTTPQRALPEPSSPSRPRREPEPDVPAPEEEARPVETEDGSRADSSVRRMQQQLNWIRRTLRTLASRSSPVPPIEVFTDGPGCGDGELVVDGNYGSCTRNAVAGLDRILRAAGYQGIRTSYRLPIVGTLQVPVREVSNQVDRVWSDFQSDAAIANDLAQELVP